MLALVPVSSTDKIVEWAKKAENAEFFRRVAPVNMWPADTASWWATSYYIVDEDKTLGLLALTNFDYFHRSVEFGILLDKELCGAGRREIAVEAITQTVDYVFNYLGFEKISAKTLAHRNSLHAGFEQYKFNKDGVLRSNVFFQGKFHDEVVYSLLKSEWK